MISNIRVWACNFSSKEQLDEYFKEYGSDYEEDSKDPISLFAHDIDLWFYDHDFIRISHLDDSTRNVAELFSKVFPYPEEFPEGLKNLKSLPTPANVAIALHGGDENEERGYDYRDDPPKRKFIEGKIKGQDYTMRYLGEYAYQLYAKRLRKPESKNKDRKAEKTIPKKRAPSAGTAGVWSRRLRPRKKEH